MLISKNALNRLANVYINNSTVTSTFIRVNVQVIVSCALVKRSYETNSKASHGRVLYSYVTLNRNATNNPEEMKKNNTAIRTSARKKHLCVAD